MEKRELVEKAKTGDKEALVRLVMDDREDYYRLAFAYLRNREDALDALGDTVVILYGKIGNLRDAEAFTSWSKTILVNRCRKMLKQRGRTVPLTRDEMEKKGSWAEHPALLDAEGRLALHGAIGRLRPKHQDVIRLHYLLDYSQDTIAGMLRIPKGTVKSRLHGALKELRGLMGGGRDE